MKLSINWICDYLDISDIPVENLAGRLTLAACEVDGYEEVFGQLDEVIAAKVLEVKKHPDADKLHVCQVDTGNGMVQIVTGAVNIRENTIVVLAPIGATLPSENGNLRIKKAKLRGVESSGMLCSAGELGLQDLIPDKEGILILSDDKNSQICDIPDICEFIEPGMKLSELLPIKDTILDIDNKSITHRPDLWCHYGFAREIAAIYNRDIESNPLDAEERKSDNTLPIKKIDILDESADAYYGATCSGVKVTESPFWMRVRLHSIGQRPINNVVDASNYLLFELGQPNHAFDASTLKSSTITVAKAGKSAKIKEFTTLDEVKRKIPEGSILIYDGDVKDGEAVALGGVMGGLHSSVADTTTDLFLESATFPRESIRKTVSGTQLRTDSSMRFEKGQDPAKAKGALYRLVNILSLTCPDIKMGKISGESPNGPKENVINVTLSFLRSRLGFEIEDERVRDILTRLNYRITVEKKGDSLSYKVTAPTYRSRYDITIAEDIVEELGRLFGYDNIEPVPANTAAIAPPINRERALERSTKEFFITGGNYFETRNYSFAHPEDNRIFSLDGLKVLNPIMEDRDRMRVSQIPGIIRQAAFNQDRFTEVKLLELGRVFFKDPKKPKEDIAREEKRISLISLSPEKKKKGHEDDDPAYKEFLSLRNTVENYLQTYCGEVTVALRAPQKESMDPEELFYSTPYLHPGCAVVFVHKSGETLGYAGLLHPGVQADLDLKRPAAIADLFFDRIYSTFEKMRKETNYIPPSVFPDSDFELSVVMEDRASTALVVETIRSLKIPEIENIELLSIYRGEPLPSDKQSASYRVRCSRNDRTLTGDELQDILNKTIAALNKKGLALR